MRRPELLLLCMILCALAAPPAQSQTFYVATGGSDVTGNGSAGQPWASISHAVNQVSDGSEIVVKPGEYSGQVRLDRQFTSGIVIRSEVPYMARLRHSGSRVVISYRGRNIVLQGFDIAHAADNTAALVIHIQDLLGAVPGIGNGSDPVVHGITLRGNIIHDSTNNDLLKINNGARDIIVSGNLFYNQRGSDEHIDINSVAGVIVEDNIFFNALAANQNNTSAYIVIKDSNGDSDGLTGARDITVKRNVFLNWQGSTGSNFLLIGEDGNAYYEAFDVLVENNLMLGNAANVMRAAFGVKGGRDIVFRYNTVIGNLPSLAFAMRLNREGSNPINQNITLRNNIWSDPSGTMGSEQNSTADFAEVPTADNSLITLDNNLYWNGAAAIPLDSTQLIQFSSDPNRVIGDPLLGAQSGIIVPTWSGSNFADGSGSIRAVFERLVDLYGRPAAGSAAIDAAGPPGPSDDILGRARDEVSDIGALDTEGRRFADLPPTHVAFGAIEILTELGVVEACGALRFCPSEPVTRDLLAKWLLTAAHVNEAGYAPPSATGLVYTDVPADAFLAGWIETLAAELISTGCDATRYCPRDPANRQQLAILVLRASVGANHDPETAMGNVFDDVAATDFAAAWIEDLAQRNLTDGCAPMRYCPYAIATRAEAALLIARAFALLP